MCRPPGYDSGPSAQGVIRGHVCRGSLAQHQRPLKSAVTERDFRINKINNRARNHSVGTRVPDERFESSDPSLLNEINVRLANQALTILDAAKFSDRGERLIPKTEAQHQYEALSNEFFEVGPIVRLRHQKRSR